MMVFVRGIPLSMFVCYVIRIIYIYIYMYTYIKHPSGHGKLN